MKKSNISRIGKAMIVICVMHVDGYDFCRSAEPLENKF